MKDLVRKNIQELIPYSSARNEFKGEAQLFLDANESPYSSSFNRYPDPLQIKLKERIAVLKNVSPSQLFLGNGSDEAIDLLIRAFCEPYQDSILITSPTYGMYEVCAAVNGNKTRYAQLTSEFQLDVSALFKAITSSTKIIFLCSPNNPTGNLLDRKEIETILKSFNGLVVVDEAYIDFANDTGFIPLLNDYPNLVILQTLSKAWGLAGLRLGICIASAEIINVLNKIKYPYNINTATQQMVYDALADIEKKEKNVKEITSERERLTQELSRNKNTVRVFPSDANFLLVKMRDAKLTYQILIQKGIIVRDRSSVPGCEDCLRITIGTPQENKKVLNALEEL